MRPSKAYNDNEQGEAMPGKPLSTLQSLRRYVPVPTYYTRPKESLSPIFIRREKSFLSVSGEEKAADCTHARAHFHIHFSPLDRSTFYAERRESRCSSVSPPRKHTQDDSGGRKEAPGNDGNISCQIDSCGLTRSYLQIEKSALAEI